MRYKNNQTFLYLEPVEQINSSDLLILDGYAFDTGELIARAEADLSSLYDNPHIKKEPGANCLFSRVAAQALLAEPRLRPHIKALNKLTNAALPASTIDAVFLMLRTIADIFEENRDQDGRIQILEALPTKKALAVIQATDRLKQHIQTLTETEQAQLMHAKISAPTNLNFNKIETQYPFSFALSGGNIGCVRMLQAWGWQGIWQWSKAQGKRVDIPDYIHELPEAKLYNLGGKETTGLHIHIDSRSLNVAMLLIGVLLDERRLLAGPLSMPAHPEPLGFEQIFRHALPSQATPSNAGLFSRSPEPLPLTWHQDWHKNQHKMTKTPHL